MTKLTYVNYNDLLLIIATNHQALLKRMVCIDDDDKIYSFKYNKHQRCIASSHLVNSSSAALTPLTSGLNTSPGRRMSTADVTTGATSSIATAGTST